jgi:hypothetical protein
MTTKINDYAISADAKAISKTIDTLAQGCKPASVVRELYHNAEDALIRGGVNADNPGEVLIARDREYPNKIVFSNSTPGDALTKDIAKSCLASIGSTGNDEDENFGIGAKISYLPRHPEGLLYRGKTEHTQFTLYKNPENIYALKQESTDEGPAIFCECGDEEFRFENSETEVVLMGASPEVNTWKETCTVTSKNGEETHTGYSIRDYLNMRYWTPRSTHITTKVEIHEADKEPVFARVRFLKAIKESRKLNGTLDVGNGIKIHYYTTNFEKGKKMGSHVTTGYYGYIYNNEVYYETDISASVRKRRMENLGILTHHKQVMVLVELPTGVRMRPTADRTRVVDDHGTDVEFLLDDIASYFKENMPEDLKEWMQSLYEYSETDVVHEASKYFKNNSNVFKLPSIKSGQDAEGSSSGSTDPNNSNEKADNPPRKRKRKAARAGTDKGSNGGAPTFQVVADEDSEPVASFPLKAYTVTVNTESPIFKHLAVYLTDSLREASPENIRKGLSEQIYLQVCEYYAMLNTVLGASESDDQIEERMMDNSLDALATHSTAKLAYSRIRNNLKNTEKNQQIAG